MTQSLRDPRDTPELRKARGAFFTPPAIAAFIANWAIRHPDDRVLEPSTGDAEFLVHGVLRLRALGRENPLVWGSELHDWSARIGCDRVTAAGGSPHISVEDFFCRPKDALFDVVIGNPPYVRFQDFAGEERARARAAALEGGVALSGLASAWAAFTVAAALRLARGGRLGFVLPAELLSSNYAGPVREFLFKNFGSVEIILFEERIFAEAETEVVLLLASEYKEGPTESAHFRQVRNASALTDLPASISWKPVNPSAKWSSATVEDNATTALQDAVVARDFVSLQQWGTTRLGIVTGRNNYFAMSPESVRAARLEEHETLPLSPPGSNHLRGLVLSPGDLDDLGRRGKKTRLFYPRPESFSAGAQDYLKLGIKEEVDQAYKCRVRRNWWQVPLLDPPDLLLTYMNGDTVRMVTNSARAHHLNSVHGVYLDPSLRKLGSVYLPLAALNSYSMLSAEITGRSYGGGILKMEPGEAAQWLVPSPASVRKAAGKLQSLHEEITELLRTGHLDTAVTIVDDALLCRGLGIPRETVATVRNSRDALARKREERSRGL